MHILLTDNFWIGWQTPAGDKNRKQLSTGLNSFGRRRRNSRIRKTPWRNLRCPECPRWNTWVLWHFSMVTWRRNIRGVDIPGVVWPGAGECRHPRTLVLRPRCKQPQSSTCRLRLRSPPSGLSRYDLCFLACTLHRMIVLPNDI